MILFMLPVVYALTQSWMRMENSAYVTRYTCYCFVETVLHYRSLCMFLSGRIQFLKQNI